MIGQSREAAPDNKLTKRIVEACCHLVTELGDGEEPRESGRNSAWVAVVLAIVVIALITWWILYWLLQSQVLAAAAFQIG
jgi:hypothetical protein